MECPNLIRAAKEIAYDNGMINRVEPEKKFIKRVNDLLSKIPDSLKAKWEDWFEPLMQDDFEALCCGESEHAEAVLQTAPDHKELDKFFDAVFNL